MSRSYKKSPVVKYAKNKIGKKEASKKVRNTNEITNGSNYKKHYNSWDICDFRSWVKNIKEFWKIMSK